MTEEQTPPANIADQPAADVPAVDPVGEQINQAFNSLTPYQLWLSRHRWVLGKVATFFVKPPVTQLPMDTETIKGFDQQKPPEPPTVSTLD